MNTTPAADSAAALSRCRVVVSTIAAISLLALLALTGTAAAKVVHLEEGSFTGSDTPSGELGFLTLGVAVDNSGGAGSGDVWVAGQSGFGSPGKLFKFNEGGTYAGVELDGSSTPAGSIGFVAFAGGGVDIADPLAVDSSAGPNAGDLYVIDAAHKAVDRFSPSGAYECQITGGTTPSASECGGSGSPPVPAGEIVAAALAVDPTDGSVYVANAGTHTIYKFSAGGEYEAEIADSHVTMPGSLSFDAAGHLYVANGSLIAGGTDVVRLSAAGAYESTLTESGSPVRVAVDDGNGHVYVGGGQNAGVRDFAPSGSEASSFGKSSLSIGVSSESHRVYVTAFGRVNMFSGPYVVPDVTSKPPAEVEEATATISGKVDPDAANGGGEVESCEVEYGTGTSYGSSVPCSPPTPYSAPTDVSAELSGLSASTTYHFRIAASNENGVPSYSEDRIFTTKGPPTVEGESAESIERYGAALSATINADGYDTTYRFQYVDAAHFASEGFAGAATKTTAPLYAGSGQSPVTVGQNISGLAVDTTYHYRAVATNSHGNAYGSGATLTTLPVAEFKPMLALARTRSATAKVEINPLGLDTSCQVEYVADASYRESGWAEARTVPCTPQDIGAGTEFTRVRTELSGLERATTYHERFRATNSSGTLTGGEGEFSTFGVEKFAMRALAGPELDEEGELVPLEESHPEEGEAQTQAGAHPYALFSEFAFTMNKFGPEERTRAAATLKDVRTELPPGMIGNPASLPQCSQRLQEARSCPPGSQIGLIAIGLAGDTGRPSYQPVFNLVPPQGVAAKFGAYINGPASVYITADVRTGEDYGINADSLNITSFANARIVRLKLWGDPGDPRHTTAEERFCVQPGGGYNRHGCSPAGLTQRPFLSMPTQCTGQPIAVHGSVDTYQEPDERIQIASTMEPLAGCNALEFKPSIQARPTTNVADSPSGLHVDIHVPQNENEEGLRTPDLKDVKVVLPPGLVINPAGANGLTACSEGEFDQHGPGAGHCPDAAKIGTAEVDTPLVSHPLPGAVYLPTPHENPFASLLALYIEVNDPVSGVIIKLAGQVQADPKTGQLTTTFDENPQLPFEDFKLDFFKGAKAPLRTPAVCATYRTTSVLTPYSAPESGPPAEPFDSYAIDHAPGGGACPSSEGAEPNTPSFDAGTVAPTAGSYSPLVIHLRREDGSQEFERLTVTPPPGLLAKLAGIPYCPDAALAVAAGKSGKEEQAAPSCPAASQIGTVNVGAGSGPAPYYVQGRAYLAGPYAGAPLSMAIITPATAGPFDLGTVVTRVALHINPETTQITAVSEPLPHILKGIPLDIRSIAVNLDRAQFTRNPTSCDPSQTAASLTSILGQGAGLLNRFQLGDCTNLGFEPKLETRIFGKTKRTGHPKFRAVLTMPEGDANIAKAAVTLPHSELLDQSHIKTVCTRVQYAEGNGGGEHCPADSVYGYATAWSPLLAQPIQGPVYLRSSAHKLPDLVASLSGQIHVDLDGRIDSVHGGIRTSFEAVPDAPVSKFMLTMRGGNKGLLQNGTNVCAGKHRTIASFDAHSGAVADVRPLLANGRCRKHHDRHRRHTRAARRRVRAALGRASSIR